MEEMEISANHFFLTLTLLSTLQEEVCTFTTDKKCFFEKKLIHKQAMSFTKARLVFWQQLIRIKMMN